MAQVALFTVLIVADARWPCRTVFVHEVNATGSGTGVAVGTGVGDGVGVGAGVGVGVGVGLGVGVGPGVAVGAGVVVAPAAAWDVDPAPPHPARTRQIARAASPVPGRLVTAS